ncbi:response regulator [Paenibacillus sp. GCM10027626]|uniref:response regulator transcription factor n=1 Tax=Paenibacillus sp. GCM10027626 TaxID=3273411 RepID=UPI0036252CF9
MYRLLIVEDEEVIRDGLKEQIPWERYGFQVVGEAGNGKDAMELIPLLLPDLILTDIVMPVMGGIELIAWTKERYPNIKFVVLSGYNEFEYARKCIEYQAFSYLLKPTETEEIEHLFRRAKNELDGSNHSVKRTRRGAIQALVEGKPDAARHQFLQSGDRGATAHYTVMHVRNDAGSWPEVLMNNEEDMARMIEPDGTTAQIMEVFSIDTRTFGVVLMSKTSSPQPVWRRIAEQIRLNLHTAISRDEGGVRTSIRIGIGSTIAELPQIRMSWKDAAFALKVGFFSGPDSIVHIQDWAQENGCAASVGDEVDRLMTEIVEHTLSCKDLLLNRSLDRYFDLMAGLNVGDEEFIYMRTVELMVLLSVKLADKAVDFKQIHEQNFHMEIRKIVDCETLPNLKAWAGGICESVIRYLAVIAGEQGVDPVIERAKAYIHEHYDRKVTLEEVCDHIFMGPSHFCALFKQKTGHTFVGYLTQVRMSKAKQMLKNADMKIYEVAVAVGYEDFRHFSKLFKKYEGMNPKEWVAQTK